LLVRPPETAQLVADPSKAHQVLGWEPVLSFEELVQLMVDVDLQRLRVNVED
jgi:GDPmannose 4,6-dehydratase